MPKQLLFGSEGREKLKKGVDTLANAVKVTLGAKGRNVIIGFPFGYPHITKDGVTVANSIDLEDNMEEMGASLIKQVASNTVKSAGDGTTTATVLAQAIINRGFEAVNNGANPMDVKRGIDLAVSSIVEKLKEYSKPIDSDDDLVNIATISANNDRVIGKIIADAIKIVGKDGEVTVENSATSETSVLKYDGMKIDRGFISPYFVTDQVKMKCELNDCLVLLYDKTITHMSSILPLLQQVVASKKPLLVISEDMDGEALATIVTNKMKGAIQICAIQSPAIAEERRLLMEDIAIATGATFITFESGLTLEKADISMLGTVNKVIVDKDKTVLVDSKGDKLMIEARCNEIKQQLTENPNDAVKNMLKSRLAKLTNGIAVLKVGAISESELKEKKDRIDDALCATKAAVEEGFVAGGGTTYMFLSDDFSSLMSTNKDETIGIDIVVQSLKAPFETILSNAGLNIENNTIDVMAMGYGHGVNVKTDKIENLLEAGVIDPTKVSRVALENAASVASIFLTTECLINEKQAPKQ